MTLIFDFNISFLNLTNDLKPNGLYHLLIQLQIQITNIKCTWENDYHIKSLYLFAKNRSKHLADKNFIWISIWLSFLKRIICSISYTTKESNILIFNQTAKENNLVGKNKYLDRTKSIRL